MNQSSLPANQAFNDGLREALNKSVSIDAMKRVSEMMTKTAKMLAMGHLDPSYMMETMNMMFSLLPENDDSGPGTSATQQTPAPAPMNQPYME